jgi:hypothetical protein
MPIWVAIVVLRGLAFYILHFALKISARSSYSTVPEPYSPRTTRTVPSCALVHMSRIRLTSRNLTFPRLTD